MSSVVYSRARSTFLSFSFARSGSPSRSTPSASAHLSMTSRSCLRRSSQGTEGSPLIRAQARSVTRPKAAPTSSREGVPRAPQGVLRGPPGSCCLPPGFARGTSLKSGDALLDHVELTLRSCSIARMMVFESCVMTAATLGANAESERRAGKR
jgi:hypothetical protein